MWHNHVRAKRFFIVKGNNLKLKQSLDEIFFYLVDLDHMYYDVEKKITCDSI